MPDKCEEASNAGRKAPSRRRLLSLSVLLLLSYVSYYLWVSRVGWPDYREIKIDGFYYLPWQCHDRMDHPGWLLEEGLRIVYTPANAIDRSLFNGPGPLSQPLWGIDDRKK